MACLNLSSVTLVGYSVTTVKEIGKKRNFRIPKPFHMILITDGALNFFVGRDDWCWHVMDACFASLTPVSSNVTVHKVNCFS